MNLDHPAIPLNSGARRGRERRHPAFVNAADDRPTADNITTNAGTATRSKAPIRSGSPSLQRVLF
jgi:hypothetical protein